MDDDQQRPLFPPELEHKIFTRSLALHLQHNIEPGSLFLVSKRVYDWLIPLYYNVVIADTDHPWPPKATEENLKRYGQHVYHFHTVSYGLGLVDLLPLCPNISNLAIWSAFGEEEVKAIIKLPLTHISTNFPYFFGTELDLQTFCSNLTHVDMSTVMPWEPAKILPHLPALTHISMYDEEHIPGCLVHGKLLKVVIRILLASLGHEEPFRDETARGKGYDDRRVVCISFGRGHLEDWKEGAFGRTDMCEFAEEVIEKRRQTQSDRVM
ncbi:hypothetical protein BDN72DRAFT_956196 [Pluteus cervinus]|uniref:Uncharacterized protein n=1 Tax=Pluteus cervinus TaxID=181527 RepID=A0ACD3B8A5_9AGAR|nr:hypothetical protein BDN72DRAFT_956196 [Pluteus cervinus]